MAKIELRQKAIDFRKRGKTYSEILKNIPVAKSTLSLWLREVGLTVRQKQRITEKRRRAQMKGANARRTDRLKRQSDLMKKSKIEVGHISKRELWLIGVALYWAEGSKEKTYKPGSRASFSNSDPKMIVLFIKWLKDCIHTTNDDLMLSIYIHESHAERVNTVRNYWSNSLKLPVSFFKDVYFKKNKLNTKRKNVGNLYNGLVRVNIRSSSDLNRRIAGWIQGITENCGLV
jgi:hypothetical protein